jgi:hypothetical protein
LSATEKRFSSAPRILGAGLAAIAVAGHTLAAPITNGGFETGNFSGWGGSAFGAVVSNAFPASPLQGNHSALLVSRGSQPAAGPTGPTEGCASDPWIRDPVCPPPPFPGLASFGTEFGHPSFPPVGFGFNFVYQTFDAVAGDKVAVDWRGMSNGGVSVEQVITRLTNGVDYIDSYVGVGYSYMETGTFGVAARVDGTGDPGLVSNAAPAGTGFRFISQTYTGTTTVPTAGPWTFYVGVAQLNDSFISSGILIDNLRLQQQALPEPNTLLLTGLAAAAALLGAGRRKKRLA